MIVATSFSFNRFARDELSPSLKSTLRLVPMIPLITLFEGEYQNPSSLSVLAITPATRADAGRFAIVPS